MLKRVVRKKLRIGLALCLLSLLPSSGCTIYCNQYETIENANCVGPDGVVLTSSPYRCVKGACQSDTCAIIAAEIVGSLCGGAGFTMTSTEPSGIETSGIATTVSEFKINGTNLSQVVSIAFRADYGVAVNGVSARPGSIRVTDTQITATVDIAADADPGSRLVAVFKPNGGFLTGSNELIFQVGRRSSASAHPEETLLRTRLMRSVSVPASLDSQSLSPDEAAVRLILTPVADGTVLQSVVSSSQADLPDIISTISPATSAHTAQVGGTLLNVIGRTTEFNFQGYGLAAGGMLNFSGTTRLDDFSKTLPLPPLGHVSLDQASSATVGVVEFDLANLKVALQQLNLNASAVHATLRLTPIRNLNLFDALTGVPPTAIPSTTQVVLLEMTQNQKDLTVDYEDFPGFTSPGVSSLNDLATTIRNAHPEQRAAVRTDLLGLPAPVVFDVTQAVQRDLQTSNASTGFQIANELNGTGLFFADSSNYIPGIAETTAPQLVIEIAGFNPPSQARFVTSSSRVPFDSLALNFTDMILVTVNNVGASAGAINIDLAAGSNVFGLIMPDGRPLNTQGNTATIAPGERLTFGVTFKPIDGQSFKGLVEVTDTTGGKRELINKIALTGSTLLVGFSRELPAITAPIAPMRMPDHAARVGDLNGDGLIDAVDIGQLSATVAGRLSMPSTGTTAFAVADIDGDGVISSADVGILGDAMARNLDALPRSRPSAAKSLSQSGGPPSARINQHR